ncbi:hypothetical protein GBA65_15000 [Rubrobacter marinus]|uniref:Uncharacterized protein n=1 Tax=Rubrobacter marinus TaxID=2653852 RepID=A0A6G8PZF3_9ACTN|nr:hypothetical protein [Rubrobacter marinus]QIN79614.1 hypothetical protein GBA65_15000 [Rubrobacter marinus]
MSRERELERLDRRIEAAKEAVDVAYASPVPDARKDALFDRLEALQFTRAIVRRRWSEDTAVEQMLGPFRVLWARLCKEVVELAGRLLPGLRSLEEEIGRSRPAFWRAVVPSCARALVGAQVVGVNGRPIWGYRRKTGRRRA